jgi:hypothetical protein
MFNQLPTRASKGRRRRILQPLMIGTCLALAAAVVVWSAPSAPSIAPSPRLNALARDHEFSQTLAEVNRQLALLAENSELKLGPRADNLEIARRVSLALVGNSLSLEELRALERQPPAQQIPWLVDYLLHQPRWADYFAERLSRVFVGTDQGPPFLFRRRKFNLWLSEQLDAGVPYDRIVRSMLSAEGLWTDTPQVNFITATMDGADRGRCDPVRLAGRTSRAFLGLRIDCLQCHDDFIGDLDLGSPANPRAGKQSDFHQLAAFFAGTALPDPAFSGIREDGLPYDYQYLGESSTQTIVPAVPFQPELLPDEGKPRARLASWVTHPSNQAFARACVNRIWALLFSKPLVSPVDNIPLNQSVPPVLDTLADDLANQGFDLRRLIQLIISTDAFQRSSRAEFQITEHHEANWAVFPISPLRPEQVAGSLLQATSLQAIDSTSSILTRLSFYEEIQTFIERHGDQGEDDFDGGSVTIPQRLLLMNGKLVSERTQIDFISNAGTRISRLVPDDRRAVELIFLSVLNRQPAEAEMKRFVEHLNRSSGNQRARAIADIYWAMINSTEFSWNH